MINNLESKSKAELIEIINIQIEADQKRENRITELERERDAVLQEAKIQACELDTQKGIVQSVSDLFDVRVYDFNLIAAIKVSLAKLKLEQQAKGLEDLADELTANTGYPELCAKNLMLSRAEQLRNSAKGDSDE